MKRLAAYFGVLLLVCLLGRLDHPGTDVGELEPVELIAVSRHNNRIRLETDTGSAGEGKSVHAALEDLKDSAAGTVFLETADYLLIDPEEKELLPELTAILRPGCRVCLNGGVEDLEAAADFLSAQKPDLTLADYQGGKHDLPALIQQEGRMRIVK